MNSRAVASELVSIAREVQAVDPYRKVKRIGQFRVAVYELENGAAQIVMDTGEGSPVMAEAFVSLTGRVRGFDKVAETCRNMIRNL